LLTGFAFCHACGAPTGTTPARVTPPAKEVPAQQPSHSGLAPTIAMPAPTTPPDADRPPRSPGVSARIPGGLTACDSQTTICFPEGKLDLILGRRDPSSGFAPDVDLADEEGAEKGVSRRHARILYRESQLYIEDLNSSNGTYVNRRQLKRGELRWLQDRDSIWLGHLRLILFVRDPKV
jgi:hypothetical protein